MSDKWNIRTLIGRADIPAADQENVVHLHRPSLDAIERSIRDAMADERQIIKEGAALEERMNECQTRLANAREALTERLSELGIRTQIAE